MPLELLIPIGLCVGFVFICVALIYDSRATEKEVDNEWARITKERALMAEHFMECSVYRTNAERVMANKIEQVMNLHERIEQLEEKNETLTLDNMDLHEQLINARKSL